MSNECVHVDEIKRLKDVIISQAEDFTILRRMASDRKKQLAALTEAHNKLHVRLHNHIRALQKAGIKQEDVPGEKEEASESGEYELDLSALGIGKEAAAEIHQKISEGIAKMHAGPGMQFISIPLTRGIKVGGDSH